MEKLVTDQAIDPFIVQLVLLAKLRGETQESLSKKCGVSRATINRYFRGKSEIKARDLVKLLQCLEVDISRIVNSQLNCQSENQDKDLESVYEDCILLMRQLDFNVQKNLFEQILWWSGAEGKKTVDPICYRISNYLGNRMNFL